MSVNCRSGDTERNGCLDREEYCNAKGKLVNCAQCKYISRSQREMREEREMVPIRAKSMGNIESLRP
jgi:hypothetical protein